MPPYIWIRIVATFLLHCRSHPVRASPSSQWHLSSYHQKTLASGFVVDFKSPETHSKRQVFREEMLIYSAQGGKYPKWSMPNHLPWLLFIIQNALTTCLPNTSVTPTSYIFIDYISTRLHNIFELSVLAWGCLMVFGGHLGRCPTPHFTHIWA